MFLAYRCWLFIERRDSVGRRTQRQTLSKRVAC